MFRTTTFDGWVMMADRESFVGRFLWLPAAAVAGFLALNLAQGSLFSPRGHEPKTPKIVAAAPATQERNDHAPSGSLLAQDERLGGVIPTTTNTDEANKKVENLRSQLKVNPKDYRLHYELGNALYDASDPAAAISAYRKSIELNPRFVKAYVNLGETLRERGDVKEAIETLEKALGIDKQNDVAHAALGFAYYTDKRYPDAMQEFKTALTINPKSVHATYYMGMAFADAQIYREAIKWWDKVCEVDPTADACLEARENVQLLRRIVN